MAWLFGQVFLLCALSFLLGSLVTWLFVTRQRRIETGRAVRTVPVGEVSEATRPQAIEPERGDGPGKADPERSDAERSGAGRSSAVRSGAVRSGAERSGAERSGADRSGRTSAEKSEPGKAGPVRELVEPAGGPGPEVLPGPLLPTESRAATAGAQDATKSSTTFEDPLSVRLTYAADDGLAWREPEAAESTRAEQVMAAGDPKSNGQEQQDGSSGGENGTGQHESESGRLERASASVARVPAQSRGPIDAEEEPPTRSESSETETTASPRMVVPGPYRNSARPSPDGTAPAPGYTVKGNQKSKLYHTSDSPYFARTKATVWFQSETDAEQAGFTSSAVRRSTSVR
ncbi:hypothetical protein FHR81_005115 [Actinoalloteichus hoggarensis]|uniref:Putative membrane protein ArfC n=1 Tax=Actinoalloteichus hoggarensis TaxID=1470176 RepID=A0A221W9Y7_9PSEU|nr:hypothetical protein [Actinoalloteichus hoggarensis]ASO22820.1 putative membrane protein ArfC [Actinoalloteichus hoggarensis]MBB5924038.1 hypothetical protein [Actinoalloteichus hoggarensis]